MRGVLVSVFLLFFPIGPLIGLCSPEAHSWTAGLATGAFSGLVAVGWAFAINRRWYAALLPLLALPSVSHLWLWQPLAGLGAFEVGAGLSDPARRIVLTVQCVVALSVGFTVFVQVLRRHEAAAARASAELAVAQAMHRTLVPEIDVSVGGVAVLARSHASTEMGGDLVDLVRGPGGEADLVLADVSGHGVRAGVVMAMLKSAVRTRLRGPGPTDLPAVLAHLNAVLCDLTAADMFATLAWLRVPAGGGRAEVALAGHLPVVLCQRDAPAPHAIGNDALPLGIDPDERFPAHAVDLGPGDLLAVFTDGLTEVRDAAGNMLGHEAVARFLHERRGLPLRRLAAEVEAWVATFGPRGDDQSLLLVRLECSLPAAAAHVVGP